MELIFFKQSNHKQKNEYDIEKSIKWWRNVEKIVQLYNGPSGYSVVTPVSTNEVGVFMKKMEVKVLFLLL